MKAFRADLHVHTVLSPCADIEMQPPLIVSTALDRGIQILSITDHNATGNIAAVQKAADGTGLTILPGMELQTAEEVHCLCIFDTLEQAHALQAIVDRLLPPLANRPDYFGDQLYVDENGDFLGRE
ncbi:MAG TPA: PHP domain-containing protein, partial [Anaerolineaceae bacterium]|nr:PHP domain-containing protein [Anaerolineaceae bacterium]